MEKLHQLTINTLKERGVTIESIAEIVYDLQKDYTDNLTIEYCQETILSVLKKREVIYAILVGIALDKGAEQGLFTKEINEVILDDNSLFGIDEILALSIINVYGSIALTNFGYVDKIKPFIIGKLNRLGEQKKQCTTFLDDLVAAIAAASASKMAHDRLKKEDNV
ncbi:MAG: phosphatidylglycerophosphatase A [Bacilli bacterium]|nr:phosphatidylglycerophosphatase A [Bacilli bacterium]